MDQYPYSYHTFVFPFLWNNEDQVEEKGGQELLAILKDERNWVDTTRSDERITDGSTPDLAAARDAYAAHQYFHDAVNEAIYGLDPDRYGPEAYLVRNFTLMPEKIRNRGKYIIERGENTYELTLNAINLKIYNTGVNVLIFETENWKSRSIEAVRQINDYGRRVMPLFLPGEPDGLISADRLRLVLDSRTLCITFRDDVSRLDTVEKIEAYYQKNRRLTLFRRLLEIDKTDEELVGERITPILDDAMFVCCIVCDAALSRELCAINSQGDYAFSILETGQPVSGSAAEQLYSIVFLNAGGASCQDRKMITELLRRHIYTRWGEKGTIFGVTRYSLVCLTGGAAEVKSEVLTPFLIEYVQMAVLTVVQRASIIRFEHLSAKLSRGLGTPGISLDRRHTRELMDLQEKYIAFQNELMFFEVTVQEQGFEIYELLQKALNINDEKEKLDSHIQDLYEAAHVNQDFRFNHGAKWLALAGLVMSTLPLWFGPVWEGPYENAWLIWATSFVLVLISIFYKLDKK